MTTTDPAIVSGWNSWVSKTILIWLSFRKKLTIICRRISFCWIMKGLMMLAAMKMVMIAFVFLVPVLQDVAIPRKEVSGTVQGPDGDDSEAKMKAYLNQRIRAHEVRLSRMTPARPYLVINTSLNKFQLYSGRRIAREGICSTGSYVRLEAANQKSWIFKTPRGKFRIRDKIVDPVWKKPDWAFIEGGLPVPPENHGSRFEYGVLGDYALSLGQGYLIHGTLYQRFLGMPVTHGCVRLNDDDLETIYQTLEVGSRVYIY